MQIIVDAQGIPLGLSVGSAQQGENRMVQATLELLMRSLSEANIVTVSQKGQAANRHRRGERTVWHHPIDF